MAIPTFPIRFVDVHGERYLRIEDVAAFVRELGGDRRPAPPRRGGRQPPQACEDGEQAMKLKMWIGNFDGSRQGLVIAPTKAHAIAIVGSSRSDFDGHWVLRTDVDPSLAPEVLYTRPFNVRDVPWFRGRCRL